MSAPSPPSGGAQVWDNDAAVSAFEDAMARGLLPGYAEEDPYVDAMAWMMSLLPVPLTDRRVFQAVPHAPPALSVEDLCNAFRNLGVETLRVPATRTAWEEAEGVHIAFDRTGHPFVRTAQGARPLDPSTAQAGPRSHRRYTELLIQAHKNVAPEAAYVSTQLRFLRREILQLATVKTMLVLASLAIALGVIAVYQWVLPTYAMNTLVALALGLVGVLLVDHAFRVLKARVLGEIAERAEYALATALMERVLHMPLEKTTAATPAQQSARLRQLMSASSTFSGPALDVALDLPLAALLLAGVAYVAPPLALVPFGLAAGLVAVGLVALPELRRRETAANAARAASACLIDEAVHGKAQIRADGRQKLVLAHAMKAARVASITGQRHVALQRGLEAAASASGPLAGGLLAIVGALLVIQGAIGVGVLLATIILSWRILSPIQGASHVLLRLAEMFERRRAINALMGVPLEADPIHTPVTRINGRSLATEGLVCRYPGSSDSALRGLSVEIPQGALVAVTGPSGSGKTTLLRAFAGLCPARGGRVLVGGLNAVQIPATTLRCAVVYVPARPHIVHGTIAQNLRLGHPAASDRELRTVCGELGILETVEALPEGFDTRVTTRRVGGLPSGFLQSLAIARAVLEEPDALLLDEPTVGLDDELERGLMRTLDRARGARTVLMVTHRPSHVGFCDLELRLQHGQLRRFGRPEGAAA